VQDEPLTDTELAELDSFAAQASPAPWVAFGGPGIGGPDFIRLGGNDDGQPDMYVTHEDRPAPLADLDFIAAARNYIPRLIAELKRTRRSPAVGSEGWHSVAVPPREFTPCPICGQTVEDERDADGWALWCDLSIQYDEIERWTAHIACIRRAFPHSSELPFRLKEQ